MSNISKQIFIVIDSRESAVEAYLTDACSDTAVFLTKSQLTIGDFAVFIGNKLRAIIERKTWTDLAASIIDGSVVTQKQKMFYARSVTNCSLIYLIEGKRPALNASVSHVSTKSLISFLDHSAIRDGIFIIQTESASDSAKRLVLFAQSISKLYTFDGTENGGTEFNESGGNEVNKNEIDCGKLNVNKNDNEVNENEINSSENALIHQPYHKTDSEIAREMWSALPGVGIATAATLVANYALSDAIIGTVTAQQIAATALITNPSRTIGEKNAAKIAIGLHKLRSHDAILSKKILECIPSVSASVTVTILARYSVMDICMGVIGTAEIAALKRATKRGDIAISAKLAERIVAVFRTNYRTNYSSDQTVSPGNGNSNPGTAV